MNVQLNRISEYTSFINATFLDDILFRIASSNYLLGTDNFSTSVIIDQRTIIPSTTPIEGQFSTQTLRVSLDHLGISLTIEGDLIRKESGILDDASVIKAINFTYHNSNLFLPTGYTDYTASIVLNDFSISYGAFVRVLTTATENVPENSDYPLISPSNTFNFITGLGEATGNLSGNNKISGTDGNDYLFGFAGKDTINGKAGDDTIDGGSGIDKLTGGSGGDTYFVDNYKDKVIEKMGASGFDTVYASTSFKMPKGVEQLKLVGDDNISAYGGDDWDYIIGNSGNNSITGGKGNDFLEGAGGNDFINGGKGNDQLKGGLGADQLTGGKGADVFALTSYLEADGDVILDFNRKQGDKILLPYDANIIDTNSSAEEDFVFIGNANFSGVGQVRFDPDSHILSGDVNGDLIADFSVSVYGTSNLTISDLIL